MDGQQPGFLNNQENGRLTSSLTVYVLATEQPFKRRQGTSFHGKNLDRPIQSEGMIAVFLQLSFRAFLSGLIFSFYAPVWYFLFMRQFDIAHNF